MTDELEGLHHPTASPSGLNGKVRCIYFEGKPGGEAAERGTRMHANIAKVLREDGAWVNAGTPEDDAAIQFALSTAKEHLRHIDGIERLLELREGDRVLTFGTLDLFGRGHAGEPVVVDWKTGQVRDHRPQGAAYALMAMDALGENEASVVFCYVDQHQLVRHEFTRSMAEGIVLKILDRVKDGTEEPTPNPYCGFCACKPKCPAWRTMAVSALVAVDEDLAELFAGGLERIKTDPESSGKFYTRAKMFVSLLEDADFPSAIRKHLEAGRIVPGFKLQRRKGRSTIDPSAWLERIAPLAGPEAASMVNVSVSKVVKWWNDRRKGQPLPVEVVETPATTIVVATTGED